MLDRELLLSDQRLPQPEEALRMATLLNAQIRTRKAAGEECMRPLRQIIDRCCSRRRHGAVADASVVIRVPIRCHVQPTVRVRPTVLSEGPDHQPTGAHAKYERRCG